MKLLFTALLVGFTATVSAQTASVGSLDSIQGLVSVSTDGVVTSATQATSLSNGSVVLNSGNGSSVVRLSNGCTVPLKPNQVLTINTAASCSELNASVKTVTTPVAEFDSGFGSSPLIAAGVVGSAAVIYNVTKKKSSGS